MRLFAKKPFNEAEHSEALLMDDAFDVNALATYVGGYTGEKFAGGYGDSYNDLDVENLDFYTLRQRSSELFNQNLYARGLIRRLITNEINTGLAPEACPDEKILGLEEGSLADWTDDVESRFHLWGKNPKTCDHLRASTFGEIQATARREALIDGDVLVVLRQNTQTKTPTVELIRAGRIYGTAESKPLGSNRIVDGVELDSAGRQVAYHVHDADGKGTRIAAYGARTGRVNAFLIYGTDKRHGAVRGAPLLSIVLQSLKEIDRYRDSATRKAVINSILAMFIKKGEAKAGTRPMSNGAVKRGTVQTTDSDGTSRNFNAAAAIPGMVVEELQHGEEPVAFGATGTDINFGPFEAAIIQAIAWANEVPPEILTLSFSSNYSASQAAINEFRIYLNKEWALFGARFCQPIYSDWLISEVLRGKIDAPGMLTVWRDPNEAEKFTTWTDADWYGQIKPSTDMGKMVKASQLLVDEGWSTNARESRILTGTKYTKNIKRLTRENNQKIEALKPLAEFRQQYGISTSELSGDLV